MMLMEVKEIRKITEKKILSFFRQKKVISKTAKSSQSKNSYDNV